MPLSRISEELQAHCATLRAINTHCHHMPAAEQKAELGWILDQSYAGWCGISQSDHAAYLRRLAGNSYFHYLVRALKELCDMPKELSCENWNDYDERIRALVSDPAFDMDVLTKRCNYDRIILDAYWKPGDDNGRPDVFAPTYRINMFLFGYDTDAHDHNGNNPYLLNDEPKPASYGAYLKWIGEKIEAAVANGAVALKCPAAYDRGLDFDCFDSAAAARAFEQGKDASEADIKAFQDSVMDHICGLAAQMHLPVQIHTGLGKAYRSNAINLLKLIDRHPETVFSLMHGSYPWTDDLMALTHNYTNVVADICWLPIISPDRCVRFIEEWIDVGDMDRITWGCDTWHSFESYGALLAAHDTVSKALGEMVEDGRFSLPYAKEYAAHIFRDNAARIYGL